MGTVTSCEECVEACRGMQQESYCHLVLEWGATGAVHGADPLGRVCVCVCVFVYTVYIYILYILVHILHYCIRSAVWINPLSF